MSDGEVMMDEDSPGSAAGGVDLSLTTAASTIDPTVVQSR
eukprot:CAMPEP_0113556816 /NCGR_PEP_ID=MMETSP0015_2-20120614/17453_1 /TAXON_ID=2838 /ORGANISM="Odontella" /LENGTH=39 /DNA_ID=CAMNT_0000458187 /DNA_START=153 /DNA_END=268 /DNA_ORIENTATION=- /assembly_acc=CAM_ASM_000160